MADQLTPQQHQAVHDRGGMLLVSAAAGSGKTKVLVDRLLGYLLDREHPANLEDFLIITYTKAAASELRAKIAARLTEVTAQHPENKHLIKQMQRLYLTKISTIHGFCGDLLREYAYRLDIPADFRVADETECLELRQSVIEQLLEQSYEYAEEHEDFLALVDSQGFGRDDRILPELIERVYDSARCHLDPDGWLEQSLRSAQVETGVDAAKTLWGKSLIDDLHGYIEDQLQVLRACTEELNRCDGMEKPAANFQEIVWQLERLRRADTWEEVYGAKEISYGRLVFPKKNSDPELTERVKAARNACKEGMSRKLRSFADPSGQVVEDLAQSGSGIRGLTELVRQFSRLYSEAKRNRRILDFSDLEQKTLDLLLGKSRGAPTAAAREIGRRYREVLVDEYQDSNGVQDAIFSALTMERQNCFLVGDVKQSIYQFRLADPGIFLEKYKSFVPAEEALHGQGRKVLLSHNFRSGPEVIEAVNDVFTQCMSPQVGGLTYGEAERLREGVPHIPLGEPGVALYALQTREDTYAEEAAFVAERIQKMLREGKVVRKNGALVPVTPEDIVILLRSPGSAAGYFQQALEGRGIRCVSGGGNDLLETEEIQSFVALLQTIQNPRQDIPLIAALASPIFGFTAQELAAIRGKQKKGSIYDALTASGSPKAQSFVKTLSILRREARMNTLVGLLEQCFALTRLDSIYAAMPGGTAKSANLHAFYQLAADYEQGGLRDLLQFLSYLDALADRGLASAGNTSQGAVSIMSIHKSKGLEFPVVFLCNLARKFNRESLHAQVLCDRELGVGLSVADTAERVRYPSIAKRAIMARQADQSVSEEMRVLYVAMTRARDRLILTYASQSLENDLRDIVLRMDLDNGRLLCREAGCPGDWVLLTALGRTEAGALHALSGRPLQTRSSDYPWKIRVKEAPAGVNGSSGTEHTCQRIPEEVPEMLRRLLSFQYPHAAATQAPSKQTATDRKGREKDAEAAEDTVPVKLPVRNWRHPNFRSKELGGADYGTAIHLALQYIRYESCGSLPEVERELWRLVQRGFLTEEQGSMVDSKKIAHFFDTEIGRKLRSGTPYLREFKFSILDDGCSYGPGLEGERVLLQGVVDCALLEEDGITVIDFKTDRVTEQTVSQAVERYRPQVEAYAHALSRIFEKKVPRKLLYFFRLDRFESL